MTFKRNEIVVTVVAGLCRKGVTLGLMLENVIRTQGS